MKKSHFFRLCAGSLLALSLFTFGIQSCEKKDKPADTEEVAEEANEAKFDNEDTGVDNDHKEFDAEFLVAASEADMKEVELGKLAQKSANPDIKGLGNIMVGSHGKNTLQVKALAASKGVTLPADLTDDVKATMADFGSKKGADFDKAYAEKMVDAHQKILEKLNDYLTNGTDPEIKVWAEETLPLVQTHLKQAQEVQAKLK